MEFGTLNEIAQKTYQKADLLYEFVIKYYNMMIGPTDYGTGEMLNMIEIHLLSYIDQNPGITVGELAKLWNRTKGAISQQVKILEKKGYITKTKSETNKKLVFLHVTPSGKKLSTEHMHYDIVDIMQTMTSLLRNCTAEEIDSFFKVIQEYVKLLDEEG